MMEGARQNGRTGSALNLLRRCALVALAVCAALASCSETKLYAPVGSIQKRLHDLSNMCGAYLFDEGGLFLSFEYEEYAPQIDNFVQDEIWRFEKICNNPGAGFNDEDLVTLRNAINAMRDLSNAINRGLDEFDPEHMERSLFISPWNEWLVFDKLTIYIDESHRNSSGSDALYR